MSRTPKRTILAAFAAASLGLLAVPSGAGASFVTGIDGGSAAPLASPTLWSTMVKNTNSGIYRAQLIWADIAPTKPADATDPNDAAYAGRWDKADAVARLATTAGVRVLFNPLRAPAWAEGPNRPSTGFGAIGNQAPVAGSWNPNAVAFGQFAKALAKRYDGTTADPLNPSVKLPKVSLFEAWNEPNYKMYLTPQCSKGRMTTKNVCTSRGTIVAMGNYRGLLNSFYAGIKSVQPTATVLSAGTGPYGASSGGYEIDPQVFIRSVLCLGGKSAAPTATGSCPVKASLDGVAIHPYTLFGTPTTRASSLDGTSLGNTPDVRKALNLAVSKGRVSPAGAKQLWITESGWMTCPPCRPGSSVSIGIKPALAAGYTGEMLYRLWSWKVDAAIWYSLVDGSSWPGGLYYAGASLAAATAKPALAAFKFPVFSAKSGTKAFGWTVSPCRALGSTVQFEAYSKSKWVKTAKTVPAADGVIKTPLWAIPSLAKTVRATASGPGCVTQTSSTVTIAAK